MKDKQNRKYSVRKSLKFMLSMAWKRGKIVIFMCFVMASIAIGINMAQLYIAPKILGKVETGFSQT